MDPRLFNGSVLAYIGDSVLEIMVREYMVFNYHYTHAKDLQIRSIDFVSANAHSKFVEYALENNIFTEDEMIYFRRGKNVKEHRTLSKHVSRYMHGLSTGFESVLGYLYLTKSKERLDELFHIFVEFVESDSIDNHE